MPNVGYRSSALTDSKLGAKSPSAPGADASSASPQRPSAFSASCLGHRHGDQPAPPGAGRRADSGLWTQATPSPPILQLLC